MSITAKWGDTRRKMEAELRKIHEQQVALETREAEINSQLKAFDEAVDALNKLPDAVKGMLLGKVKLPKPAARGVSINLNNGVVTSNENRVLGCLVADSPTSALEIAHLLGIDRGSVNNALRHLHAQGKVRRETGPQEVPGKGKAPYFWFLSA